MKRQHISQKIVADVMEACRRRCCLCVFLDHRDEVRKGQIAHLNRKASDSRFANLVYLCLDHHDTYDSRTSQSKALTEAEVRRWRDRLYEKYPVPAKTAGEGDESEIELPPLPAVTQYEKVIKKAPANFSYLNRPWKYPLWQVANKPDLFAYKVRGGMDGICLIERIDIPDGRIVIVCMQANGNPGQGITNAVEEVCFQVCQTFDIPAHKLVWIEHYDCFGRDDWNLVTFKTKPPRGDFANPTWTALTPEMWHDLRLRPKRKMKVVVDQFQSKVTKLFHWPTEAILR